MAINAISGRSSAYEYVADIDLADIGQGVWGGIVPSALVTLVKNLLSASKDWKHKNNAAAHKLATKLSTITMDAMCDIWEKRKSKLQERAKTIPTRSQTCAEQARELASQGLLTGGGGTGTMTHEEFALLPKRHRMNKVAKALCTLNNLNHKTDRVAYLPAIGQEVRTYLLDEAGTLHTGSGTVTSYNQTELKPYQITTDGHGRYTINTNLKELHRNYLELDT